MDERDEARPAERVEAETVFVFGRGVRLRRVFGEFFVEAQLPEDGWTRELREELARLRAAGELLARAPHTWIHHAARDLFAYARDVVELLATAYDWPDPAPAVRASWARVEATTSDSGWKAGRPVTRRVSAATCALYLQVDEPDPDDPTPGGVVYRDRARAQEYLLRPRVGLLTAWPAHVERRALPSVGPAARARERVVLGGDLDFAPAARRAEETSDLADRAGLGPSLLRGERS
ncbi:MAG: hypothetical protein AB7N76_33570 [Planctomycetota bacterium]